MLNAPPRTCWSPISAGYAGFVLVQLSYKLWMALQFRLRRILLEIAPHFVDHTVCTTSTGCALLPSYHASECPRVSLRSPCDCGVAGACFARQQINVNKGMKSEEITASNKWARCNAERASCAEACVSVYGVRHKRYQHTVGNTVVSYLVGYCDGVCSSQPLSQPTVYDSRQYCAIQTVLWSSSFNLVASYVAETARTHLIQFFSRYVVTSVLERSSCEHGAHTFVAEVLTRGLYSLINAKVCPGRLCACPILL